MLELGMGGHRYFDLQRWDGRFGGPPEMGHDNVLKAFTQHEAAEPFQPNLYQNSILQTNKHEIYPIKHRQYLTRARVC